MISQIAEKEVDLIIKIFQISCGDEDTKLTLQEFSDSVDLFNKLTMYSEQSKEINQYA